MPAEKVRIAYASDSAFGFYHAGDLDAAREAGAELVPFSPLQDKDLPSCDGLFLGGGFRKRIWTHCNDNATMRVPQWPDSSRTTALVYAECGG